MSWNDILIYVVNVAVKAVVTFAIPCLFAMWNKKIKNDHARKLILKGEEFVLKSIDMVQQTFVDSLKAEGKFDADAQKEAYKLCYNRWMAMASDDVKAAILEEVGDLDAWLDTMIEAGIAEKKQGVYTLTEIE